MEEQQKRTPEEELKLKLAAARSHAIGEAMREVMSEQKDAIIRRARAKLTAMGIKLEEESDAQVP